MSQIPVMSYQDLQSNQYVISPTLQVAAHTDDLSECSIDSILTKDDHSDRLACHTNNDKETNVINEQKGVVQRETVIARIEDLILMKTILEPLTNGRVPHMERPNRSFLHNTHCRLLTNVILVADFCHELLIFNRSTTIREVYYHFVTHFRNQSECDKAIWDLALALQVPRAALGLSASPKGWTCGCLDMYDASGDLMWNGRLLSFHGMSVTPSLLEADIRSHDARCIVVIEKEGVYTRLSEDKFFLQYPCILVCGKGFPDIVTRQWVRTLAETLSIPVLGLCDCNPYGLSVLHTYHYQEKAGEAFSQSKKTNVHLKWIGLRPSHVAHLSLPPAVFQQMTDLDLKRLDSFLKETHLFHQQGNSFLRVKELECMKESGRKVELEALNWLGVDFLCAWLKKILEENEFEQMKNGHEENDLTYVI